MKLLTYLFLSLPLFTFASTNTAITVALEPDSTMVSHATSANTVLKANYPKGFALDESHHPHMTLVQAIVRTQDLDQVYAKINEIIANDDPKNLKLHAKKYKTQNWEGLDLAMIAVDKSDHLVNLQQKLADAIKPFIVTDKDKEAFATTSEEPGINKETLEHARKYIPNSLGPNYKPNVTVGVAAPNIVDKKLNGLKPFDFSPVGITVYKIGNFGAAHEELKTWR
jgi:hypothetical protein